MNTINIAIIIIVAITALFSILEMLLLYSFNSFYYSHGPLITRGEIIIKGCFKEILNRLENMAELKTKSGNNDVYLVRLLPSSKKILFGIPLLIRFNFVSRKSDGNVFVQYWSRLSITQWFGSIAIAICLFLILLRGEHLSYLTGLIILMLLLLMPLFMYFYCRHKTRKIINTLLSGF
ncbi:hypothetical protein ES705_02724 [subsurface metagenome]